MKINLVTLCSGIEAQGQALRRLCRDYPQLEWELLAWSEIDKNAIAGHNAIFPEYADRNLGDMTTADYSKITEPVDVLFYSTPCQSVSVAGQNKGMKEGDDAASALIWHTRRAIETLKPKIAILENVKGMTMGKNLKEFHKWQQVMESYGYTNFSAVLNSRDYLTPQNRERLFMVSILGGEQSYKFPEKMPLKKRIKDILEPYGTVDESYYFSAKQLSSVITHCDKKVAEGCGFKEKFLTENEVSGCDTARYSQSQTDTYIKEGIDLFGRVSGSQDGIIVTEDSISRCHCVGHGNGPKVAEQIKEDGEPVLWQRLSLYENNAQAGRVYDVYGIFPCLDTCSGGNRMVKILEPAVLTPQRTEQAKELRRQGIETFAHRQLVPREDGCSNTVTTVQKDNMLIEPCIIQRPHGFNDGGLFHKYAPTITTSSYENNNIVREPVAVAMRGRNPDNPSDRTKGCPTQQRLEFGDKVANCVTTVQKDSMVAEPLMLGYTRDRKGSIINRHPIDVANTIHTSTGSGGNTDQLVQEPMPYTLDNLPDKTVLTDEGGRGYLWQDKSLWRVRKLIPMEVGRLMDVSDDDTQKMIDAGICKTALYGLFGNSIVVSVLYHIFRRLFVDTSKEGTDLSLFD